MSVTDRTAGLPARPPRPSPSPSMLSRRRLLRSAGLALPGLLVACRRGIILEDLSELDRVADPALRATLRAQATAAAGHALGATSIPAESGTPGATGTSTRTPAPAPLARALGFDTDIRLTANDAFYTMKYHPTPPPEVRPADFRLRVDGLVEAPISLDLATLEGLPQQSFMRTLECISNPAGGDLIGNAVWAGVRLADVLALVRPRPEARHLKLSALDGYHTGIPLELALDPRSCLVHRMNGELLPAEHGFPLRCLFPGRYGQKQPKWISGITLLAEPHVGHWEGQGWSDSAEIQINSRFDRPADRATVTPPVALRGIAFSGLSGVAMVEIVVEGGGSHAASLRRAPEPDTALVWTEWDWSWDAPAPGNHRLMARAEDGGGRRQHRPREQVLQGTFPDGSSEMQVLRLFVPAG